MSADRVNGGSNHLGRLGDRAVGPRQVFAPGGAEHASRRIRLEAPLLEGAIARQLALGQIAQSDAIAGGGVPCDRAAKSDFDVVGMRAEHEQLDRHLRHDIR